MIHVICILEPHFYERGNSYIWKIKMLAIFDTLFDTLFLD